VNAIKKAILELAETKPVRTITADDVAETLTLERNATLTPKEGEDFPPSIVVSHVEFDSSMASVMHRVTQDEAKEAAMKKIIEGGK